MVNESARRPHAFTIVEVLVVIVIIGLLASIAIVSFGNTRKRAFAATMKSDLRNLVSAEEAFFSDSNTYVTYDTARLKFNPSPGVTPPAIVVGAGYWSATVTHAQTAGFSCGIAVKTANPLSASAGNGEPVCQ